MKQEYRDIVAYVDAVSNLAEQLQGDIIRGDKISIETIVCLSKLHSAAKKMEKLVAHVEKIKLQIN